MKNSQAADERQKVRDAAFRLLAVRARSRKELDDRLMQKGHSRELIDATLDDFREKGYQSDDEFARLFTQEKWRVKGWGPQRLRAELYQKGIAKALADSVIEETIGEIDQAEAVMKIAEKRWRITEGLPNAKRKQRLIGFLQRRGYGWDVIGKVLDRLS